MVVILSEEDAETTIDPSNLEQDALTTTTPSTSGGYVPRNVLTSESGDQYYSIAKINIPK